MDVSLSILKFAAVLIVGILGVLGLQVEYKKNGVITKWGRRALWGTVISTLVAIAIQSIETYKQHLDRIEADATRTEENRRVELLLNQINRAISPFQNTVQLSILFRLPESEKIAQFITRVNNGKKLQPLIGQWFPDINKETDSAVAMALRSTQLNIWILKNRPHITNVQQLAKATIEADLHMLATELGPAIFRAEDKIKNINNLYECEFGGDACAFATYEAESRSILVEGRNIKPTFRSNSGTIKSLPDFSNSTVLVQVAGPEAYEIPVTIDKLTLKTKEGRELVVDGFSLIPHSDNLILSNVYSANLGPNNYWN